MGFYTDQVLPRATDLLMRAGDYRRVRARVLAGTWGEVIEIGSGSGLNLAYYPPEVTRVTMIEPALAGRKIAAKRAGACRVPAAWAGPDAQELPVADASADCVVSTWTLCSIPDPGRALAEIRRVLRPGGAFHFAEHGLAPDEKVARLQHRLTPIQRRVAGGCHFDRPIAVLITASGLELTKLTSYYFPGPKFTGYSFEGVATKTEGSQGK